VSRAGESTFAEIFVNCSPEKTNYKAYTPDVVILGIAIKKKDLIVTKILLEKILAPVPSSTSPLAGDKNEIVVDFRLGFTESERNNIYFTAGDIFSELGGLAASFKLIWSIVGTITVLRFMYDFSEMIKRKGSHKFRVITIEKYKKCFPQILAIIAEKTKNLHDTSDPEYNNYLEDKESIEQIKRA